MLYRSQVTGFIIAQCTSTTGARARSRGGAAVPCLRHLCWQSRTLSELSCSFPPVWAASTNVVFTASSGGNESLALVNAVIGNLIVRDGASPGSRSLSREWGTPAGGT